MYAPVKNTMANMILPYYNILTFLNSTRADKNRWSSWERWSWGMCDAEPTLPLGRGQASSTRLATPPPSQKKHAQHVNIVAVRRMRH